MVFLLVVHGVHVLDELQNLVGVTHLVVVPVRCNSQLKTLETAHFTAT